MLARPGYQGCRSRISGVRAAASAALRAIRECIGWGESRGALRYLFSDCCSGNSAIGGFPDAVACQACSSSTNISMPDSIFSLDAVHCMSTTIWCFAVMVKRHE
jgi:hypothetical protein